MKLLLTIIVFDSMQNVILGETDPLFYPALNNYHMGAQDVNPSDYEWMVRVVISKGGAENHICNAICYADGLFLTTARCMQGLSPHYIKVKRDNKESPIVIYFLPAVPTKQSYNDIAVLVTLKNNQLWKPVKFYNNSVDWREDPNYANGMTYTAVGYATSQENYIRQQKPDFQLKKLSVVVGDVCKKLYPAFHAAEYDRPCYHSCTTEEAAKNDSRCSSYIGAEGTALFSEHSQTIMGIASWGFTSDSQYFPVGLAIFDNEMYRNNVFQCGMHMTTINLTTYINRSFNSMSVHPDICSEGCNSEYVKWYSHQGK